MTAWPLEKIELAREKAVDDETSFPKMDVWIVVVHDPKDIKLMHDHLKARGFFGDQLSHVKTIRKTTGDLGETAYQIIVGTGSDPPVGLPKDYPSPIQYQIPATAAIQRAHLEAKNLIWPTVYSPHLIPRPVEHTAADIELVYFAMNLIVMQAQSARAAGDHPIAACVLQDQILRSPVVVSDTRNSSKHPLHHAVLNLIQAVASSTTSNPHPQVQGIGTLPLSGISSEIHCTKPTSALESLSFHSTPDLTHEAVTPEQDPLQNGEGYQLTNRTLYITHEPCIMCTMALVHARVKDVVFIHSMPTTGGCGGTVLVPELKTINHRFNVWRWKDAQTIWPSTLTVREIDV